MIIKENLDDKYEEVLGKIFKKYIDKDFISKDKIREKIKEIENYTYMSNEEMRQHDYAIIKLDELLEV